MTNRMKTGIAVLALILANVLIVALINLPKINASMTSNIVEENGYMVIEDNVDDISTIVCGNNEVTDDGYFCSNLFDSKDVVFLSNSDVNHELFVSNIMLVTFNEDIVIEVKLNHLKIADKISGQFLVHQTKGNEMP